MKLIVAVSIALLLCGCSTTRSVSPIVTREVPTVIAPPDALYNCPSIVMFPNPETLTNEDLAILITKLVKNNKTCKINMDAIKAYVSNARLAVLENEVKPK